MAKKVTMFKNSKGVRVPVVTTIIGQLDKPGLMYWAHKLGLEGVSDLRAHRDAIGQAGNLAHELALPFLSGIEIGDTLKTLQSEYTPEELALAVPIMNRFAAWAKGHEFQTSFEEESFISERYQFGGRIDWFGIMDGVPTLLDLKFTKALYPESTYQMSAYRYLLKERGIDVDRTKIIRIGRTEEEGFEEPDLPEEVLETGWNVFLRLREIYDLAKTLPKTGKAA